MTARGAVLREMTWTDIPAVAALEPELFPDDAWSQQTWWAELAVRPRRGYVVAQQGGVVVGYAGVNRVGDVADVMTIAVAPAAQGQGVGRELVGWLIGAARGDGAEHLMLEVRADNIAAQRLYSAAGFELLTVRRRYYEPAAEDAHIMRLHLDEPTEGVREEVTR